MSNSEEKSHNSEVKTNFFNVFILLRTQASSHIGKKKVINR